MLEIGFTLDNDILSIKYSISNYVESSDQTKKTIIKEIFIDPALS